MTIVGLDFETYSSVDLRKGGLDNYVNDKHFRLLVGTVFTTFNGIDLDFVSNNDYDNMLDRLRAAIDGNVIAAHNAGFEHAVLQAVGIDHPLNMFIDTAVTSRQNGFSGTLELAVQQMNLGTKMEEGAKLIQLFCTPGKDGELEFDMTLPEQYPNEWALFKQYCRQDALLSRKIAVSYEVSTRARSSEQENAALTMHMNNIGWHVDMASVDEMQRRYEENCAKLLADFQLQYGTSDLNLNSHTQLIKWCKERGVTAKSFDEKNVARLIYSLEKKVKAALPASATLQQAAVWQDKVNKYHEVLAMLRVKQQLGGSSLKKLPTIKNITGPDGRLRNQYLHLGAAATFRTSGRGVQMQNLKRLHGGGANMENLYRPAMYWDNELLASNIRQVFTATDPAGFLIVGDFASVESRGLAYQANETWKLLAYDRGQDLYKVQAAAMFGIADVADVTKEQRQIGKVGELACGYGAGPDAVREFAAKMGVSLDEQESSTLVRDWRNANPEIVNYWDMLNFAMHSALELGVTQFIHRRYVTVSFDTIPAPTSLQKQTKDSTLRSLRITVSDPDGNAAPFTRVFHGASIKGRNVQYFKPSERKTGPLWADSYVDPKTKRRRFYTLYGGKLAGLITQSLCREIFFASMHKARAAFDYVDNVQLIGQFHDELVADWQPGPMNLATAESYLSKAMSSTEWFNFPLAAEIKHDYRYTK